MMSATRTDITRHSESGTKGVFGPENAVRIPNPAVMVLIRVLLSWEIRELIEVPGHVSKISMFTFSVGESGGIEKKQKKGQFGMTKTKVCTYFSCLSGQTAWADSRCCMRSRVCHNIAPIFYTLILVCGGFVADSRIS